MECCYEIMQAFYITYLVSYGMFNNVDSSSGYTYIIECWDA